MHGRTKLAYSSVQRLVAPDAERSSASISCVWRVWLGRKTKKPRRVAASRLELVPYFPAVIWLSGLELDYSAMLSHSPKRLLTACTASTRLPRGIERANGAISMRFDKFQGRLRPPLDSAKSIGIVNAHLTFAQTCPPANSRLVSAFVASIITTANSSGSFGSLGLFHTLTPVARFRALIWIAVRWTGSSSMT